MTDQLNAVQRTQQDDLARKLASELYPGQITYAPDDLLYLYGGRSTKNQFEHKTYPDFPFVFKTIKSRTEEPMSELSQTDRMWEQEANRSLSLLGTLIPNRGVHSHDVETVYNEHMQALIRAKQDYDAVAHAKQRLDEIIAEANKNLPAAPAQTNRRKSRR
jgi:hypothetical protein